MAAEIKPDKTLDCKGLYCPLPVLKAKDAIEGLAPGQVLEVISTDEGSKEDIPAWTRSGNHELLEMKEEGGLYIFLIKKAKE
jgi:tRNA 2-thiouridine synthesizing protein A